MADERKNNHEETEVEETEEEDVETGAEEEGSDDKGSSGKSGTNTGKSNNKPAGKTFSQEQVNRMMTREKNQGRNSAFKELGIDPRDSKSIAMVKALIESQKTDEQKAAEQAAENQRKNDEAERRAVIAEAKAEAMMLGVKPQHVDDIVTLALSKMTDDSDLKTIIGEYKTKYPVWFGESDEDESDNNKDKKGKTGQKGTGSSIKNAGKNKPGSDEPQGIGARLAAQRKAGGKKSSYWGKKD